MSVNKILIAHRDYPLEQLDAELQVDLDEFNTYAFWSRHEILFGLYLQYPRNVRPKQFTSGVDTSVPDYTQYSTIGFDEATDRRAQQLIDKLSANDLPILIFWSGGIDSTLIVAAVYKNFPKEMRDRVIVVMNNSSYIENPVFFERIIKPTFRYTSVPEHNFTNANVLHGDLADTLWLQGNIVTASAYLNILDDNVKQDPSNIIKLFTSKTGVTEGKAHWALDFLVDNAKISNVELTTTADVVWWANFILQYETMCNKRLDGIPLDQISKETIDLYFQNFNQWYMSDLYQVWSIQAQFNRMKFDNSVRSYKMPAKEYIFDVDNNQYYRDYKTKMKSPYLYFPKEKTPFVIYENGTVIKAQ